MQIFLWDAYGLAVNCSRVSFLFFIGFVDTGYQYLAVATLFIVYNFLHQKKKSNVMLCLEKVCLGHTRIKTLTIIMVNLNIVCTKVKIIIFRAPTRTPVNSSFVGSGDFWLPVILLFKKIKSHIWSSK
jgi:hypothetical protein